jgi:hypothetical protein
MPHAVAQVNGTVIAESDSWEVVEGNVYVRHLQCETLFPLFESGRV